MPKKCGDGASLMYEVEPELIGDVGIVSLFRKDGLLSDAYCVEFSQTQCTQIDWPDQLDDKGKYYGGRKADFRGLDKLDYKSRFKKQEFELALVVGDSVERSGATTIEGYPEVPRSAAEEVVGIPMTTEQWKVDQPEFKDPITNTVLLPTTYMRIGAALNAATYKAKNMNCGRFFPEFKDGIVIITVKVKLVSGDPKKPNTNKQFKYLKKRVEEFWNSNDRGFNRWVYHRKECKRQDKCGCTTAGCCKFPFRVNIEKGGGNDHVVSLRFLNREQRRLAAMAMKGIGEGPGDMVPWVNTGNLYYPENRPNTYAHEVGHMMGFPDQYEEGVTAQGAMSIVGPLPGAAWPIDESSVMGGGQTLAKKIHLDAFWFRAWIYKHVDKVVVIDK